MTDFEAFLLPQAMALRKYWDTYVQRRPEHKGKLGSLVQTERASDSWLRVRELTVRYRGDAHFSPAVDHISFEIGHGEILGIQGRSGCGKTSTALAILKLLPKTADVSGSVTFRGLELLKLSDAELRKIRGRQISIIYQEPAIALNPVMRIGDQVQEVLRAHTKASSAERKRTADEMLDRVRLSPARFARAYPHELSGGERHRVVLAQALVCRPSLVIADEPTAGLDPALKSEIADLIATLRHELQTAFLLISHDSGVISRLADRTLDFLGDPASTAQSGSNIHSISSAPPVHIHPDSRQIEPLLVARHLSKRFSKRGLFVRNRGETQALDSVDIAIEAGKIVGLVGASGSGKSTLAKCLALMEQPDLGEIQLKQTNLLALPKGQLPHARCRIQYVPQDPASALNPRFSAAEAVEEPLLIQGWGTKEERRTRALSLMESVGLDPLSADRSCQQFSGGQKQRLVVARALALDPKLLIYDESLSGLDPQTKGEMVELIQSLKLKLELSQLLISHDLDLVNEVADSVFVMSRGRIVEQTLPKKSIPHGKHRAAEKRAPTAPRFESAIVEVK